MNLAVIDLETDPFKYGRIPRAFLAGFYDGSLFEYRWGEEEDILPWLVKKIIKFEGIVYAHNGGKFDFIGYVVRYSQKWIYGESAKVIGGRIVSIRIGSAEVRDSYAILPSPLSAHDKGTIDYKLFEKGARERNRTSILEYFRRDHQSLYALVRQFIESHGTSPLTAASAGFKYLKKVGYKVESLKSSQDEKFRKFYYGGLVLARRPGIHVGRFSLYDIKSAYPYAMLHTHPAGTNFDFKVNPKKVHGFDMVLCKGRAMGCFLVRKKEGGSFKLSTPCESGMFFTTGWEYNRALSLGLFMGKVLYVERSGKITDYSRYVNHFYEQKQKAEAAGDSAGRLIAKIMLNAVYGKFAQRKDGNRDYAFMPSSCEIPPHMEKRGWQEELVDEKNKYSIWSRPSNTGTIYNVATAASITGFVRAMLLDAIQKCDPYYCDTDSVVCDTGSCPGRLGDEIGQWVLEVEGDRLYIGGKKLYALRLLKRYCKTKEDALKKKYYWDGQRAWKIASKGARLTPDELYKICKGETVTYENQAPSFSIHNLTSFVKRNIKSTCEDNLTINNKTKKGTNEQEKTSKRQSIGKTKLSIKSHEHGKKRG